MTYETPNKPQRPSLLPPPWADFAPPLTLRDPFTAHPRVPRCSDSEFSNSPSSSPDASPTSGGRRSNHRFSQALQRVRSRSGSPFTMRSAASSLRLNFLLRRRPSTVDLALSEERSRCSEDSAEKVGLGMMEPRPVDPVLFPSDGIDMVNLGYIADMETEIRGPLACGGGGGYRQPPCVMGGIFEVMEGAA
ncbi:hypothetical protein AJ80_03150 [Polytolypa hystricis UAMH7299]|uniref:Uncharacterized protein n=1 Tax=Polytolypa hystricis (strain UAMH7299) TaxID=1447883 RepID=A0A2B7YKV9_POLH7|nr:hypothetical protein AJ80_03150 [Polytolypa hystricis UAMH7299]